jgi:hypothetical protein
MENNNNKIEIEFHPLDSRGIWGEMDDCSQCIQEYLTMRGYKIGVDYTIKLSKRMNMEKKD